MAAASEGVCYIVWNVDNGDLKAIGFNIASKFDVKISYLGNPEKR